MLFWFDPPSLNNNGGVTFNGGPRGILTGGQTSSAVNRVGDALLCFTVASVQIGRRGLNDSGHVAFWYKLAAGRNGYARADSIPDCQNGLDADGKIADTTCTSATGSVEAPQPPGSGGCGIGPELALGVPLLAWARRRRREDP